MTGRRNAVTFIYHFLGCFAVVAELQRPRRGLTCLSTPRMTKKCENNTLFLVSPQAKKLVCTRCAGTPRRVERRTALASSSEDGKLGCGHGEHLRILIGPEATEIRPLPPKVARGLVTFIVRLYATFKYFLSLFSSVTRQKKREVKYAQDKVLGAVS